MKSWISFPRQAGDHSKQAHADFPEGTYEREMGKEGFFGPTTHFHHREKPTGWISFEGPLRPRAFDTNKIDLKELSPWDATMLLENQHMKFRIWKSPAGDMDHLVRNGDGDDLMFVHSGEAEFYCDFGHLSLKEGDYVMIPRGTMWRVEKSSEFKALLIEATNNSYFLPEKGLVGKHAIFDPACLDSPALNDKFKSQQSEKNHDWSIVIKKQNQLSTVTFPYNPLDCVGWHGDLSVVRINWRDIRPLMSHRYHLPPSAHTTFASQRFVVCTFCPRPIESDPGALKVPFFHNNDDYDEVIFYHLGDFFSRDEIEPGMITFHPSGFTHGPHPKAFAAGKKFAKKETDEVAVMIDTRDAVEVTEGSSKIENVNYVNSWREK